jgi:hypothetical protein
VALEMGLRIEMSFSPPDWGDCWLVRARSTACLIFSIDLVQPR